MEHAEYNETRSLSFALHKAQLQMDQGLQHRSWFHESNTGKSNEYVKHWNLKGIGKNFLEDSL